MHPKTIALLIALSACASQETKTESKVPEPAAVTQQFSAAGVIVKKHDDTEIAFTVDEAGKVKAAVRKAGEAITTALDGELTWRDADGAEQRAPLELDSKTGLVETKSPLSNATDVSYTLNVLGTPIRGTLTVPGTTPPPVASTAAPEPTPAPTTSSAPPPPPPRATAPTSTPTPTPSQRKESSGRFPPKTR